MGSFAHCKHLQHGCACTKTEKTCTQRLQTFHRVEPYKSFPMKVHTIERRINELI